MLSNCGEEGRRLGDAPCLEPMSTWPGWLREARDVAYQHFFGHRDAQRGAKRPEHVMHTGRVWNPLAAVAD
jgi:hypothetical protein